MGLPTGSALSAHGLAKRFGLTGWALRDVELAVPFGSMAALVGPNGAGKSTLIRTWIGFERPSLGQVFVGGVDPWRDRAGAQQLCGYVAQTPALYLMLTVGEHLDMARSLRSSFDVEGAAVRVRSLGLKLNQRAAELSGGSRAQLSLAIALATRAPVLLLDEPLASLDPLARREFLRLLAAAVRDEGRTALISSHVIGDVDAVCDYLIILCGGSIQLSEPASTVRTEHFIVHDRNGAPMNNVIGAVPQLDGGLSVVMRGPPVDGSRPATLEEVVIGYLSAARVDGDSTLRRDGWP